MTMTPVRSHLVRSTLLLALAGGLAVGCALRPEGGEDDPEVTAQQREQLDHALSLCEPVAANYDGCEVDDEVPFLSAVGYCVSMVGEAGIDEPACMGAVEDYLACLAELDCDELVGGSVDANPGSEEPEPAPEPGDGGGTEPDAGSDTEPGDGGGQGEAVEVHEPCEVQLDAIAAQCAFFGVAEDHSDGGAEPDPDMGGSDGG